ncbi:MAG TPA: amino acid adenylation domain-containing protein, partial [Streptosporangiaceae bacterium]|nr:amino acid adenylation domain-containing protein [Streptosporangiaceae bacterium]
LALPRPAAGADGAAAEPGEHDVVVASELAARLQGFAQSQHVTVNTLVQGAWALLLGRYGGCSEVVFGMTTAGRPGELAGVERMVGLFINTLPRRVALDDTAPVGDWLRGLQGRQAEEQQHGWCSLVDIQHWSGIASGAALFDTLVVFENYPVAASLRDGAAARAAGLRVTSGRTIEQVHYPLYLAVMPGGAMVLRFGYRGDLFDAATIERLAGHFVRLLEELVADPARRVSEVSLLGEAERRQLVTEWNDTGVAYPDERCLHELFAEQAARAPAAPAVIFQDQTLSYGELDHRANQLAHYLRRHGIGPDTVVGLCVERSPAMIVGVLGILKAGGAYLPLDPGYPAERLGYMLSDAGTPVLVTQEGLIERVPADAVQAVRVVRLDADAAAIAEEPETAPRNGADPDNLAYVIYTSGSTGRPKGVMIPHRGAMNLAQAQCAQLPLGPHDRVLQFASFSFDAAVWDLLMSWRGGAALVMADRHDLLPGEPLLTVLERHAVTTVLLPPSALAALPAAPLPRLATLIVGGEACTPEILAPWLAGRKVLNAYGPTEASVCTTVFGCVADGRTPALGRPLANTRTYVLDNAFEPVPVGVAGELYIGGIGLARGYAGRPALTAERFVPSPFGTGERLYRTGDLVRWRPDGNLEFLGRIDDQVKVRGFRIELGEIEAALAAHAGVRQAAVVAREETDRRLVAYVVPADGATPDVGDLRAHLGRTLPDHMVPQAFVTLASLPLMPNGKLDRKALPAPGPQGAGTDYVAPRNDIEATLARLFAEVLGHPRVGILDNFFELGGDSILCVCLVSLARGHGIGITPRQIFEHQSVGSLAAHAVVSDAVSEAGIISGIAPLTPIQHWFFQQPGPIEHFNQAVLLQVPAN